MMMCLWLIFLLLLLLLLHVCLRWRGTLGWYVVGRCTGLQLCMMTMRSKLRRYLSATAYSMSLELLKSLIIVGVISWVASFARGRGCRLVSCHLWRLVGSAIVRRGDLRHRHGSLDLGRDHCSLLHPIRWFGRRDLRGQYRRDSMLLILLRHLLLRLGLDVLLRLKALREEPLVGGSGHRGRILLLLFLARSSIAETVLLVGARQTCYRP